MNPIMALAVAGIVLAGTAGAVALATSGEDEAVSYEHTGTVATYPASYRLAANGGEASCSVTRGADRGEGLSDLTVSPGCAAVLPGMEKARFWKDEADGSVAFSTDGVDDVVTFGVADGIDYESFRPVEPVITLAAAN